VEKSKDLTPQDFFIKLLQKKHNLGEFFSLEGDYFGFDKALKRGRASDGFVSYEIELPVMRKITSAICSRCKGSGWDNDLNTKCLWCEGTGHELRYDWKGLQAISASLHILNQIFEAFNQPTSASNAQLLTFQVFCGKEMGSYVLAGHYGADFCKWLSALPVPCSLDRVLEAMEQVHRQIYGKIQILYNFQAYVEENAWLILSCPGDACGLHPVGYSWKLGQGREFSCHNMDTPAQQVMLLAGLAVLSDMLKEYSWEVVL
jgi:hypothetical protein